MKGGVVKINPQSKWTKFTHGERSFYQGEGVKGHRPLSLKAPPEGVKSEETAAGSASDFDHNYDNASLMDEGKLQIGSDWRKVTYLGVSYYEKGAGEERTLAEPKEGIRREITLRDPPSEKIVTFNAHCNICIHLNKSSIAIFGKSYV